MPGPHFFARQHPVSVAVLAIAKVVIAFLLGLLKRGTVKNSLCFSLPLLKGSAFRFVLGTLCDARRNADRRFRQDGHILTCVRPALARTGVEPFGTCWTMPGSASIFKRLR
jgi:hypothetical protein